MKYQLQFYIEQFIQTGYIPPKCKWKHIVCNTIQDHEEQIWKQKIENRLDLKRFYIIHTQLREHRLIALMSHHTDFRKQLSFWYSCG